MKLFLQSIMTTTVSISFAGTLKNAVQSAPIDLNGTIYYQSCSSTKTSNEIVIKARQSNIECHVKFPFNNKQGQTACQLANQNHIESAICSPSGYSNPAVMSFEFDGSNFSYVEATSITSVTKCADLDGEWELSEKILNGGLKPKIIFRLKQNGCKSVSIDYLVSSQPYEQLVKKGSSWKTVEMEVPYEEPIPSGLYITDGKTSPSWDVKSHYVSTISEQGLIVMSPYSTRWKVMPGFTKSWDTETSTGWTTIEVSTNQGGYAGSSYRFVKINKPINEGSCHNLRYTELPIDFVCKTSSGFRWKKTDDGWADLSKKGKSWTLPILSRKIVDTYRNEIERLKSYKAYCSSLGKSLPTIPRIDQKTVKQDPFGLDWEQSFADLDFNSSDGMIAFNHEMKELFPEMKFKAFLTGLRSLERDTIWGFNISPDPGASLKTVHALINDIKGFGWESSGGYTQMLICNGPIKQ